MAAVRPGTPTGPQAVTPAAQEARVVTWQAWERLANILWWGLLIGGPLLLTVSMIWEIR